ncbi:sporulation-delaying protein SdpB family protein [Nocardia jiangxiensis]|uniref:sporulation-delaying protein SdpB family protein n=1 Tax=Nocardia jiangxiensis TaxID=282685 RepID=UPI000A05D384|nr:sporulation-delaying protein SdpB family protein [Nocardia jiangxiensis]
MFLAPEIDSIRTRILLSVNKFDHRNRWWGTGRTLLALAYCSVLLLTPMNALLQSVAGVPGPRCEGVRAASALCIGDAGHYNEWRKWTLIAIFLLVASGYRPRVTAILHLWATYSLAVAITLPDGGEAIGLIICGLITPLALADNRRWHWSRPPGPLRSDLASMSLVFAVALRLQLAFVYFDATIAKFGNSTWAEGTAIYYVVHDSGFGDGGPLKSLNLAISATVLGTIVVSWGALAIESAVGTLLVLDRSRKLALMLDLALHVGIALTIGLWSFGLVMIGGAVIASNPDRAYRQNQVPDGKIRKPDAEPVRFSWGNSGFQLSVEPGAHSLKFVMRYRGIRFDIGHAQTIANIEVGESKTFLVSNGWINQHPFKFREIGGV